MNHTIRQRVINQFGLHVSKVVSINGELGSGISDIHGREIFEGDIVKPLVDGLRTLAGNSFTVEFEDGLFSINSEPLFHFNKLEVVGHTND